ncbi:DUF3899 domain-containing protein [Levilactobacillus humaensis]|uniref:DUF3899 domain-containing protein n=1 Tax=Levilactobacillus humaensis TaxID=2950375 RepID=UPI0021C2E4FA|nr:DUF3899 domain-containing protein [Levilactobacillus humaensis]
MTNWQRWTTGTLAVGLIVALVMRILKQPLMVIGNLLFMIGLALLVLGMIGVLAKGHLFTGWRRRRRKGDPVTKEEREKKIDVRHVATVKNSPIVVNGFARYGLVSGGVYVIIGIILTLL